MRSLRCAALICLAVALAADVRAQGSQTGEIVGVVRSNDGLVLPGATVTVKGPSLQGERAGVTDANGNYVVRALPPGSYDVRFEMSGMQPKTETAIVELGRATTVNATMAVQSVTEAVTVVGEVSTAGLTSTQIGANFDQRDINLMPTSRTLFGVTELSPGLTTNTPNGSQVTISGGFGYDNVFMINGVDVNDNVFGNPNSLFIEDAIEQTSILTSAISAEYGHFSGGVINAITRSGGNRFSGSFRVNLSNPSWTDETPLEKSQNRNRTDVTNPVYEATLGGPILRDRLWFFTAGRRQSSTTSSTLPNTNLPFEGYSKNERFEVNGTSTLAKAHTIRGNYIRSPGSSKRVGFSTTIDPNAVETPEFPNDMFTARYSGVFGQRVLVSGHGAVQRSGFRGVGGFSSDLVDSPFFTLGVRRGVPGSRHYNAPYFDATDPEDRDNRQFAGSLAYYLTSKWGSHDLKGGFDHFTTFRTGGNSQSSTGYVFLSDYLPDASGAPAYDAAGRLIPVFVPGVSRTQNWIPVRGAEMNTRTLSLYAQDNWALNSRLSLNLGVRYERVRSEATGGIVGVDTDTIVPRLAASWDVEGNGRTVLQASYSVYSGRYNDSQIGRNTNVGNPDALELIYTGPPGQGRDFAPGFDPANYTIYNDSALPTINVFFEDGLSSPTTAEITLSAGRRIGSRGYAKATYTKRSYSGFIEDFIDDPSAAGKIPVVVGPFDLGLLDRIFVRNSDAPERRYQGVMLQANYTLSSRLTVEGHWTVQLQNEGNFEGEGTNTPGISSLVGDYPEIYVPERNFPTGRLNDFQRHRARVWAIFHQGLGRFGALDVSPMVRIESGLTYSLAAANVALSSTQLGRNPGYAAVPSTATLFFDERGSESFKGYAGLDLAVTYSIPVFRGASPWIKGEVLNVTNHQPQTAWDTTVTPDPASPRDAHGLPTGYVKGTNFGRATANTHYARWRAGQTGGRTYLFAAGVRF